MGNDSLYILKKDVVKQINKKIKVWWYGIAVYAS